MKIMLTGSYSSLNKGDFAMSQALIKEVLKRIDDVEFHVFVPFPELDKIRYLQYFNYNKIYFEKELLRNPSNAIFSNLCVYLNNDKSRFNIYDIIIDVSGDTIGETYSFQTVLYQALRLNLFGNLEKKVIVAPQSIGPFTYSKFIFKRIFHKLEMIYVRDPLSYKYLQDMELRNISLTSDLAFLLGKCENELNIDYLNRIRSIDNIKIGLNLSHLLEKFFRSKNIDIIKMGIKLCYQLHSMFRHVHIIYIPHVFGPSDDLDDRIIGKLICNELPFELKEKLILIENEMNHEELKAIISEMDLFIGARMHACIGAISVNTPFINIAYSDKSVGLISQYLELPDLCVDIRTIRDDNEVVHKILENIKIILENKDNIRKILTKKSIEFRKKAENNIEEICNIIKK